MIEIIPNWHPVFIHYPIAFSTAAVGFIGAATLFKDRSWAAQSLTTGRWMLWAAAIFACISAVFGWIAYNSVAHDEPSHVAMTLHRNWALLTTSVLVLLAAIDFWAKRAVMSRMVFMAVLIGAWLLVVTTAWHGGEAVFRHGLGVKSLPKVERNTDGHQHEHPANEMPATGSESHGEMDQGETMHDAIPANKVLEVAPKQPGVAGHSHESGVTPHHD